MEEKKQVKISFSTILLVVALIVIAVMGWNLYNLNNENTTEKQSANGLMVDTNNESKSSETKNKSFSELMDLLYLVTPIENGTVTYDNRLIHNADISVTSHAYDDSIDIQACTVGVDQGSDEVSISLCDTATDTINIYTISGIEEEIVSISVLTFEAEAVPGKIYMLTREGNVYYAENINSAIAFTDLVAKKVEGLSEVISLNIVGVEDINAYHGYNTVIASKYDGSYEDLNMLVSNEEINNSSTNEM